MKQIIASTYEVMKQLGSGGNGIVYLANHLRLNKKVILKADKRDVDTEKEILRREVDVLKELKHQFIPQVYDYFIENDVAYTVMEYIEGESLDKPLKRGERFSQPQVIHWAIQLLEALCYLHEPIHGKPPKGYIHSDIKPANLMLRPDGSISLIDFNVALAIGDTNTYGISIGYASPEHYGSLYDENIFYANGSDLEDNDEIETVTKGKIRGKNTLDARSDIYAVGATLYHLLSGLRPQRDARKVKPLSNQYSAPLISIIEKAMNPNPDLRYQSAEEMLNELLNLYNNDPCKRRLKTEIVTFLIICTVLFFFGVPTALTGLRRMQLMDHWLKVVEQAQSEYRTGSVDRAVEMVMEVYSESDNFLAPNPPPEAQYVLTTSLGVYDLSDSYRPYKSVVLPSNPSYIELSPDGSKLACICNGKLIIVDTETVSFLTEMEAEDSALSEVKFLTNSNVIFSGINGITSYDCNENKILWTGEPATKICISDNGKRVCGIYKDSPIAAVYSAENGSVITKMDFGSEHQLASVQNEYFRTDDGLLEMNEDGTILAVSFENGALRLYYVDNSEKQLEVIPAESGYSHFEGGFYKDFFAFSSTGTSGTAFAVINTSNNTQRGGFQLPDGYYGTYVNPYGICVCEDNTLVKIDPISGEPDLLVETNQSIDNYTYDGQYAAAIVGNDVIFYTQGNVEMSRWHSETTIDRIASSGGYAALASEDVPTVQLLKYQKGEGTEIVSYDRNYQHDEARLSSDESCVTLFRYDQFRIYGRDDMVKYDTTIPDANDVYDQQYVRNGEQSILQVIYRNGLKDTYDATTGELIDEIQESPPDKELKESFETDDYSVWSSLHDNPIVKNKKTGQIKELTEDGYLTYVTQVGENLIVQYVTADNQFCGWMLDEGGNTIAYLPYLCDVKDENLMFDYPDGTIRCTKIKNLCEIIEKAHKLQQAGGEEDK